LSRLRHFISLSMNEIKQLYYFNKYNESERRIIDVFVLDCLMGLRYGDLASLNTDFFKLDDDGNLYYSKYNQKTIEKIDVPITPLALEILDEYDYQPFVPANALLNRRIKKH
jgi:integrase